MTDSATEPLILQGDDILTQLAGWLDARGRERVLVLSGPSRRHVARLMGVLGERAVGVYDGARVHVPAEVVAGAAELVTEHRADAIVAVGGGAVIGLGKALRIDHDLAFAALPTTFAGSEHTTIYGIRARETKRTGRDPRVRPQVIGYLHEAFVDMPPRLALQSLMNALAHPVSALSTGELDETSATRATEAALELFEAILHLADRPGHAGALARALEGSRLSGAVLEAGRLGRHHAAAHVLGGRFDLPHAELHALLLPQFLRELARRGDAAAEVLAAARSLDPAADLYDVLVRAGAPVALRELGVEGPALWAAIEQDDRLGAEDRSWLEEALVGRRPGLELEIEGLSRAASMWGADPAQAERVVVALHGRGGDAGRMAARARAIIGDAPQLTVIAPQAEEARWYPRSYKAPLAEHGEDLEAALAQVEAAVSWATARVGETGVSLLGFSQGACLALEYAARSPRQLAAVVALAGARIGPVTDQSVPTEAVRGTPVLIGTAQADPWIDLEDARASAAAFEAAGAQVQLLVEPGDGHRDAARQRIAARRVIVGEHGPSHGGFGAAHESEALPGALPRGQNSPRRVPYGLFAEQVNASGFVAERHDNLRSWLYRVRPSSGHLPFRRLEHETFTSDFVGGRPDPNLVGHRPLPLPTGPTDFIDGMHTYGGAGDPALRRGIAVHLYAANRSMEERAFYNGDGDMLIVPSHGRLTLLTELGVLELDPGQIAVIPRGLKFSVLLRDDAARGYVGEIFARHFELPGRGPAGANGLTDARHFVAPAAWAELRLAPEFRLTAKFAGELHETQLSRSPYDVLAWHGNYTPYVYDLQHFSPLTAGRFDHPDPSLGTVLTSPLDEQGAHALDFVAFVPRWDPSEGTFRPPYFHRNITTEFNGIVRQRSRAGSPFEAGMAFLTPHMTAHGVMAASVDHAIGMSDTQADRPTRGSDESLWFQFESALPLTLTEWARTATCRIDDWSGVWGRYQDTYRGP